MENYSSTKIETLYLEYKDIYPILEDITAKTKDKIFILVNLLDASLSQPLQYRIKSWESVREKLGRTNIDIKKIVDMQDLIGFRVVMLFARDVEKVGNAISKSFRVIEKYDTGDRLGDNKFGYRSTHYVVGLDNELSYLIEKLTPDFKIEIQVRTLAQHLWAEVSHLLSYKHEESVPQSIKRELNRTAAMLENIDSSFEKILDEREKYRSGIIDLETDSPLNVDLLQITLNALWPTENKLEIEPYEFLLHEAKRNGIDTQKKLTHLVKKHRDDVIKRSAREAEYLRNLINTHPPENGTIKTTSPNKVHTRYGITKELKDKVQSGIFYGHVALTIAALQFETGKRKPLDPLD